MGLLTPIIFCTLFQQTNHLVHLKHQRSMHLILKNQIIILARKKPQFNIRARDKPFWIRVEKHCC